MRKIKFRAWDKGKKVMILNFAHISKCGQMYTKWQTDREYEYIPMQFTGLHDKNGKEIFEGDIIKIGDNNFPVIFDEKNAQFTIDSDTFSLGGQSIFYEVIGNIYLNNMYYEPMHTCQFGGLTRCIACDSSTIKNVTINSLEYEPMHSCQDVTDEPCDACICEEAEKEEV